MHFVNIVERKENNTRETIFYIEILIALFKYIKGKEQSCNMWTIMMQFF